MENEGTIGLTHISCFRAAAAPTLATRVAMICRIILNDLLFLKARRQGRREDVKWHTGCTCCGNEKRGPLSMYLTLSVRGGHNDDMSTDRRDVMPGRMGGEENESRQEGRMGG